MERIAGGNITPPEDKRNTFVDVETLNAIKSDFEDGYGYDDIAIRYALSRQDAINAAYWLTSVVEGSKQSDIALGLLKIAILRARR